MQKFTTYLLLLFCGLYGFSQGTDFTDPIEIASLPYNTTDDTSNYGDNYDNGDSPCSNYYLSGDDVVYAYTPLTDGTFIISLSNISNTYAGIHVFDGLIDDANTSCVDFLGNSSSSGDMSLQVSLDAFVTYYIVFSTWASPQSFSYTFDLTELNCTQAVASTAIGATDCTTSEFYVDVDVTSLNDGVSITDGTNTWPVTTTGITSVGPFTIGNNVGLTFTHSDSACDLDLGTFGYICPATNDECADAIELTVNADENCGVVTSGLTVGATASSQTDDVPGTPNNDVWFYFTATSTVHNISLSNVISVIGSDDSSTDMAMGLYDGSAGCSALTLIEGSDPNSFQASGLTVGTDYYLRVFGYWDSIQNTTFDVCVGTPPSPPANNDCANADVISVGAYGACNSVSFDNTYATDSGVVGSCEGFDNDEKDVWYSFTTNSTDGITLEVTTGTSSYVEIAIYDSCGGSEVYCQAGLDSGENLINVLQANTTYILQVWTEDYDADAYEFCISDLPACPDPSDLGVASLYSTSAWLEWNENGSAANWDIEWGVAGFTPTGTPNVNDTMDNPYELTGLSLETDYDFYVRSDCGMNDTDVSGWVGPYSFTTLPTPPANDDCANAIELTVNTDDSCTITTSGTTLGASASAQADDVTGYPNTDVWYYFEATSEQHTISLSNVTNIGGGTSTSTDMGMGLYDGTNGCNALALVDDSDPNSFQVSGLTIGNTYYVRVYGWYESIQNNTFDLCISTPPAPPANDDCDGAFTLTVEENIATLADATQIPGTIASATNSGITAPTGTANDDVWFSFVATTTDITIDVTDDFDGVIELFSGDCNGLTSIENDDYTYATGNPRISRNDFVVGQTYYVRVYNYSSTTTTAPDFTIALWTSNSLSLDSFTDNQFTYFPNPVNNVLNLKAENTIEAVNVYNLIGQKVLNVTPGANNYELDMTAVVPGTYFVNVIINNTSKTIKIVKK
ncbi:T9SS type A sorting domain-containing protein [Neptunitalea lumnitzerae]|uniref:Fibronectin type-III domain-containing protein n=1 Tax=Neptunitalea lumnitzerae TaxID=2965509 RepID=A0ABQ5ML95_9FLAO|nr:T9SS type A sorting domain-containing protein [Neptunitalea sp. Y10]GLB49722.1 hypothetical protein Y10_20900 [Neptunitalea sp. Y10]